MARPAMGGANEMPRPQHGEMHSVPNRPQAKVMNFFLTVHVLLNVSTNARTHTHTHTWQFFPPSCFTSGNSPIQAKAVKGVVALIVL